MVTFPETLPSSHRQTRGTILDPFEMLRIFKKRSLRGMNRSMGVWSWWREEGRWRRKERVDWDDRSGILLPSCSR